MDDIIYEKDYREIERSKQDEWNEAVFDRAVNGGMLRAYAEAMDRIPKIIVPEDQKNYEYLLDRCDVFVKRYHGRIKGIVDYHHYHSEINMYLSFAEFSSPEDLAFLKEITEKAHSVCFFPDEERGVCVHIFINYFDELMSDEHKAYIEYEAIMNDEVLPSLLGIPEPTDEDRETIQRIKEIFDRIDEETRIDRNIAFRAVLDKMKTEPEEKWSLRYVETMLTALLYFLLNGGNEEIDKETGDA